MIYPPSFMIIGTMRGGTTSLHRYLSLHPKLKPSKTKETHFFDWFYHKGIRWYQSLFSPVPYDIKQYESTPHYLMRTYSADRIRNDLGSDLKFIVLLRDPCQRAWSHFCHRKKDHKMTIDDLFLNKLDMVRHGEYIDHLEYWWKIFPRENFMILKSEDFFFDPREVTKSVFEFLEVNPIRIPNFPVHDPLKKKISNPSKEYPPIPQEVWSRLYSYYQPFNCRLKVALGENFIWDKWDPNFEES